MGQALCKVNLHVGEVNAILRAFRAGHGGFHVVEIEFQDGRVGFFFCIFTAPQALGFGVRLNASKIFFRASRQPEIVQRSLVHREETARCTVFRGHVGDGGSVGQREGFHARTKEFYKLPNNTVLTKHLDDTKRHVRGRYARLEAAFETHADNVRRKHVDWLAEHHGFRFNAAHTPAKHAETVDHGGVRVRAHQRVGQPDAVFLPRHARKEFQIDLVDDATGGGHGLEIVEGLLAPLQERVALHVAVILNVKVHVQSIAMSPGNVNLNRVVNDQINRHLRVDLFRVPTHLNHGVPERREVNNRRHPCEILQDDSRRTERDFATLAVGKPRRNVANVVFRDQKPVVPSKSPFEKNANGIREVGRGNAVSIERIE